MSSVRGPVLERPPRRHSRIRTRAGADVQPRAVGTSLGGFPIVNVVILEMGIAAALVVVATMPSLWWLAVPLVVVALLVGAIRWNGRWAAQWAGIIVRFGLRKRSRGTSSAPLAAAPAGLDRAGGSALTGREDARVVLLRLLIDDLLVVSAANHDEHPIGLAWHEGTWTAALVIDPVPAMVSPVGPHTGVPLAALAQCLQDRGVVLDAVGVIWHCYPGGSRLPVGSSAVAAYHEVLGPLPAVAQRSIWVTVRLDPSRCPAAVRERGGGVAGAHRAVLGALSRVQGALDLAGLNSRVLSADELLRAAMSSAELTSAIGAGTQVQLTERWRGVRAGGIEHASYSITAWPSDAGQLDALTSIRALSTTVALAMSTGSEDATVAMRGVVRLSARTLEELAAADERLSALTTESAIRLSPLNGQQAAAVAATLPVGGAV
ncbi:MAG: type VII secretion protein EccE [Mycobacteriaceae bacterium]